MVTRAAAITGGGGGPYVTLSGITNDWLFFFSLFSNHVSMFRWHYYDTTVGRWGSVADGRRLLEMHTGSNPLLA